MQEPRISVVVPVYNGETFIVRAIESVLAQTWPAHEIIVVDDGSTDETPELVARFGANVQYIRQDHEGVSAARNRGVGVATGDWIAFLDADDWYYPQRLRRHAEWLIRDPDLSFLTGDYNYVRADGSYISRSMDRTESGRAMLSKAKGTLEVVMEREELGAFIADHFGDTHTLSVPRSTFLRIGGYPTGYPVCEDVYFLMRLCADSSRVGVICEPLAAYVIHAGSATRKDSLQSQYDNVRALEAMCQESRQCPSGIRRGVYARMRQARRNLGYALVRDGRRVAAARAVLPNVWNYPAGIRDVISMLLG